MRHNLGIEAVGDFGTAGVHHGQQGHVPVVAGRGDLAQIGQHEALVGIAQIDVHGHGVGPVLDAFFHRTHKGLGIGVGGQHGGGGEVDDQTYVLARAAVGAADQPLVHEHGIRAADGHVVDGFAHVHEAVHRADGDAVIHGNDNGAMIFTIDDAFQTNLFAEIHGKAPCGMRAGRHG